MDELREEYNDLGKEIRSLKKISFVAEEEIIEIGN